MAPPGTSDSRVWVNPETGGVESTLEWQRRLNAGDPEAHRQLAELANASRPVDGLDQDSLVRACMQLARRLREAEVPGAVADFCEDAARWLVNERGNDGAAG